jgi:hypothetical protein
MSCSRCPQWCRDVSDSSDGRNLVRFQRQKWRQLVAAIAAEIPA